MFQQKIITIALAHCPVMEHHMYPNFQAAKRLAKLPQAVHQPRRQQRRLGHAVPPAASAVAAATGRAALSGEVELDIQNAFLSVHSLGVKISFLLRKINEEVLRSASKR